MNSDLRLPSPFALTNIRRFLAFRVLFNARFYYPVFTVLFLDFGLSLEQFALLNTVWAFTIVLAEVPSGALADLMGRKRLLVATSLLMLVEMALIAWAPAGSGSLVFWLFLGNRVISGLAEAMSSGTDEALAYDTLVEHNMADKWPLVLDWQMRLQNLGFIFAMTLGAMAYDHDMLNRIFAFFALSVRIEQNLSMRLPIFLSLIFALLALLTTLGMQEPDRNKPGSHSSTADGQQGLAALTGLTLRAGAWIVRTPYALAIILFAMSLDHILRMLATLTSQYYRLIGLPESVFGLIGSAIAVIGLVVPRLARAMVTKWSPGMNLLVLSLAMLVVLVLLGKFIPYYGVLPMAGSFIGMMMVSFFTSHYLNAITSSAQRATVLSFKGMAFNIAYGCIGIGFAALIRHERLLLTEQYPQAGDAFLANTAFKTVISWFPWYLVLVLLVVCLLTLPRLRGKQQAW
ncbi:MAG: MFS transporter [Desulfobulbaceae bacterium]|nr:MFS transporter [Desulfobulbaceae bacterium]